MKIKFRVESQILDDEYIVEGNELKDCVIKMANIYFYNQQINNENDLINVFNDEFDIQIKTNNYNEILQTLIDCSFNRGEVIYYVKVNNKVIFDQDNE